MGAVGMDARLPAGQGNCRHAQTLQRQSHQSHGSQLTGCHQGIQLPLGRVGIDFLGLGDEMVRGLALCGYNHNHLIALAVGIGDDPRHMGDPLGICHRASSEFLYNKCHVIFPPLRSRSGRLHRPGVPAPASRTVPGHPEMPGQPDRCPSYGQPGPDPSGWNRRR